MIMKNDQHGNREAGPACRQDSSVDAFNVEHAEAYTRAITRWVALFFCGA